MRILLTESTPGAAKRAEEMFRAAGYDIAFCHPEHGPGNDCVVFRGASHCPLRTSEIDVVVDVRAADGPQTARELGATCAVRAQRRLVVAGPADPATFPWSEAAALCPADDLVGTCEQVVAPADADAGREAERAAGQRLQAAGHSARATALIVHGAGETAVLVALSETVSEELRAGITAAVRLALRGRKGFSESPRILLIDPGDTGPCEPR